MKFSLRIFLLIFAIGSVSAQVTSKTFPHQAVVKLKPDPKTLSFQHPKTGDIFTLHPGEALVHDTGGITEVPPKIKGFRDATSSYWEPKDESGGGYACAESSLTRDATHWFQYVEIQYQPDTGCILITEDKSDASPCMRHILFKPFPNGGYEVTYLCPKPVVIPKKEAAEFHDIPLKINLLPGKRAEVNGKIMRLKDIPQSPHPFSLGG